MGVLQVFPWVGRNSSQPIRVRSIDGEYLYLSHLLDAGGEPVQALRRGSVAVPGFRKPVDWWSIQSEGRNYTDLYLYGYGEVVDLKTIANFQFDNPRAVLEELNALPSLDDSSGHSFPGKVPVVLGAQFHDPPRNSPEWDIREGGMLGELAVLPPDGYVSLSSCDAATKEECLKEFCRWMATGCPHGDWPVHIEGEHVEGGFLFVKKGADGSIEGFAAVYWPFGQRSFNELEHIALLIEKKASLYSRGMRAGTFAPHRDSTMELHWTTRPPKAAECSHGYVRIGGQTLGLALVCHAHPELFKGKNDWWMTRGHLAAWSDKIKRANGEVTYGKVAAAEKRFHRMGRLVMGGVTVAVVMGWLGLWSVRENIPEKYVPGPSTIVAASEAFADRLSRGEEAGHGDEGTAERFRTATEDFRKLAENVETYMKWRAVALEQLRQWRALFPVRGPYVRDEDQLEMLEDKPDNPLRMMFPNPGELSRFFIPSRCKWADDGALEWTLEPGTEAWGLAYYAVARGLAMPRWEWFKCLYRNNEDVAGAVILAGMWIDFGIWLLMYLVFAFLWFCPACGKVHWGFGCSKMAFWGKQKFRRRLLILGLIFAGMVLFSWPLFANTEADWRKVEEAMWDQPCLSVISESADDVLEEAFTKLHDLGHEVFGGLNADRHFMEMLAWQDTVLQRVGELSDEQRAASLERMNECIANGVKNSPFPPDNTTQASWFSMDALKLVLALLGLIVGGVVYIRFLFVTNSFNRQAKRGLPSSSPRPPSPRHAPEQYC